MAVADEDDADRLTDRNVEFAEPPKDLLKPIVVLVDYQKHKIETATEEQYEAMVSS